MRRHLVIGVLMGFILMPTYLVQAQDETDSDSLQVATEPDSVKTGASWVLLPIVFSSPDTRWGFGILPQYIIRMSPESRPSRIALVAFYTQNRQYNLQLIPEFWLPGNEYRLAGNIKWRKWPNVFYGIGNDTPDAAKETYTDNLFSLELAAQKQVRPGLFAGLTYTFRTSNIDEVAPDNGQLVTGAVPGSDGGRVSGLGAMGSWDTRNHIFYPTRGSYFQLTATFYGPAFGSAFTFNNYLVDLRQYIPLFSGKTQTLVVQAVGRFTSGAPPFTALPGIGQALRGYNSARYIDRNLMAVQVAYRIVPILWRFGFVVFAGVGDVANQFSDLSTNNLKYTIGAGIRFQWSAAEKINIRLDMGWGRGSSGYYVELLEAF